MSIQPIQSRLERFKEIRLTERELTWMLIGVAAGLVLGLLVGWVWQPAERGAKTDVSTAVISTPPVSAVAATGDAGNGANLFLIALGVLVASAGAGALVWLYQQGALQWRGAQTTVVGPLEQSASEARPKKAEVRPTLESSDVHSAFNASSTRVPVTSYRAVSSAPAAVPPVRPPAAANVAPFDEEEEGLSSPFSSASASMRSSAQTIAPSVAAPAPFPGRARVDDAEAEETATSDEGLQRAAPDVRQPAAPVMGGWAPPGARVERYPTIDELDVKYVAGSQQLDWARNIPSPQGDLYLGEYGVGVSERHGMLNNDPDQVVAMEVYLFDKSDDKNLSTVGRIILSEYADTHLRKHFEREKDRLGPIVAQPNTVLQLETRQFLLLCKIVDVAYRDGIFERLEMKLELKKKV
ncbi:hypothetical protein [Caldilinea sp.]|jgi:hypothetical protein|uniref:hypothetical protein n=1 Tax=Caldilinea sp. TaxID=2293560 RepID=UPI00261B8167|nr:hypothetical protein [uncultured Caldilinea sp.]